MIHIGVISDANEKFLHDESDQSDLSYIFVILSNFTTIISTCCGAHAGICGPVLGFLPWANGLLCYLWIRMVTCPFEVMVCGMVAPSCVGGCLPVLAQCLHSLMKCNSVYCSG